MDEPRLDRNLAGYCGLFCGACDVHCLHARRQEGGKRPIWSDIPEVFQKNLPFRPAPVECEGCRSDHVFENCSHCWIRSCAKKRRIQDSCAECGRYPCLRYAFFGLLTLLTSLERKLPHLTNRKANREQLVRLRVDGWLNEQDAHWRCPKCQARYSWYAKSCVSCGRDLSMLDRFARGAR